MEIKRFEYPMSVCKVTDYSKVNLEDAFVFLGGRTRSAPSSAARPASRTTPRSATTAGG
jgi:hypothetical protein